MKSIAIGLILVGVAIVIWGAFGFVTKKKVVDIGPLNVSKNEQHDVPYGPLAGGILAVGGIFLLVKSKS